MSLRPSSVRARLTILISIVFGATLVVASLVLVRQVESALVADARVSAVQQLTAELTGIPVGGFVGDGADEFRYYDAQGNQLDDIDIEAALMATFGPVGEGEIVLIDPTEDGSAFDDFGFGLSSGVIVIEPETSMVIDPTDIPPVIEIEETADRITLGVPVGIGSSDVVFAISRSLHPVAENLETIVGIMLWAIPLLIIAVGLMTWIVVGRTLQPIQQMASDVDQFSSSQLSSRVTVPRSDAEIAHMARTVNGMLERIEDSVRAQREFVSDASHELRSPIATIGAEVEVARAHPDDVDWDRTSDVIMIEQRRLGALVDDLLLLSRFDEGATLSVEEVDLDDIVWEEIRRSRSLTIGQEDVQPVRMLGDRRLLGRMVGNLLTNAERHARTEVAVSLHTRDGDIMLVVEDDGPGVPSTERDRIFERFARLEEGRGRSEGGTGLGLAIVSGVAGVHGGRVEVEDSDLGGARFIVTLPKSGEQ